MTPAFQPPPSVAASPAPQKQQIGTAHMQPDGTIVMQLRMVQGQAVGDIRQTYAPGSADYTRVLHHLPGLKTQSEVPVYNDWD
jgi:hypothetical protein